MTVAEFLRTRLAADLTTPMRCSNCGSGNSDDKRFCGGRGAAPTQPADTARVARLGEPRDVSEGERCPLRSLCLGVLEAKRARLPFNQQLGYADGNASKMEVPAKEVICRE